MTISSEDRKAGPFTGNGSTTSFPFDFKVFDKEDLQVILKNEINVETTLVLDSDYSVTLNADQDADPGGSVAYPISGDALPSTETLTVLGALEYLQPTDITNSGGFYPQVIENALDRLVILIQQLKERIARTLTLAITTPDGVNTTLPTPEGNKLIGWNPTGTGFQNVGVSELATVVSYGTANADKFTGDGVTAQFGLSDNPGALNNLDVSVDGLTQTPGVDYTWDGGTVVTFITVPPAPAVPGEENVLIRYMQGLPFGVTEAANVGYTDLSGSGSTVQAAMPGAVDTYAAARLLDGSYAAKYLTVRGRATINDGGQGVFIYDFGDTTTADNGTTVLVDAIGRRWKRHVMGAISVAWFGAKGDGSDEWSYMQAALDFAAIKKQAVYFPQPTSKYCSSKPLVVDDGVRLIGDSRESVVIEKTTTDLPSPALGTISVTRGGSSYNYNYDRNAVVIFKKPAARQYPNGVGLDNITLQGKSGVTVDYGVYAPRLSRSSFRDVYVSNVTNGWFTYDTFTCLFERVDLWNVSYGFRWENDGSGLGSGTSCTFIGCGVNFASVSGWQMYGLAYSSIIGSFSESIVGPSAGSRPAAWFFQLCKGLTLSGCGSEAVKGYTFRVSGGTVNIRGGDFSGLTGDTFSGDTGVVYLDGGAKVQVDGGTRFEAVTSAGNIYNEIVVGAGSQLVYNGTVTRPSGGNTSPIFTGGGEILERCKASGKDTRQDSTGTWTAQEYFQHQLTLYDPASLADGAYEDVTIATGTRAQLGDLVVCSFSLDLPGLFLAGRVSAAGTIKVQIRNESGATVDLAGATLLARVYPK